jgi:hypothetical protein
VTPGVSGVVGVQVVAALRTSPLATVLGLVSGSKPPMPYWAAEKILTWKRSWASPSGSLYVQAAAGVSVVVIDPVGVVTAPTTGASL